MVDQAVVFPGQGAQRPGMALDFAEAHPEARDALARANDALPFDLVEVIERDEARLNLTEYTQPCILAAEVAMFAALGARYGFRPARFGGHSLGEYTALVAAGALGLEDAVRLVHLRGQLMQRAVPAGRGAMAAVIQDPLPLDAVRQAAEACGVDLGNDNAPTQVVLSGLAEDVDRALAALAPQVEAGMRVVPLTVSAPFHSRHMAAIEGPFREALEGVRARLDAPKAAAVTSNFLGGFHAGTAEALIDALTRQISGTVRWRDNMAALLGAAPRVVEVGPNRPLRGFFKNVGAQVQAVVDVRSAAKAFDAPQEVS